MAWYEILILSLIATAALLFLCIEVYEQHMVNKAYREALQTLSSKIPGIESAIRDIADKVNR